MNVEFIEKIKALLLCGEIVKYTVHGQTRSVTYTIKVVKNDHMRTVCGGTIPICNIIPSNFYVERRITVNDALMGLGEKLEMTSKHIAAKIQTQPSPQPTQTLD